MNYFTHTPSPLGMITLQANEKGLTGAWFEQHTTQPNNLGTYCETFPILIKACHQIDEYFSGVRTQFELPLAATGTPFQQRVWQVLCDIPFGETWSYLDIAVAIGNPKAVRAVGLANGKNPISVIVPCHRVIGKNGKLTGYAGGIERKAQLLKLEGVM